MTKPGPVGAPEAVAGAAPLATASDSASTSLNQASGAMSNQVNAFHSAYNSVVEMPAAGTRWIHTGPHVMIFPTGRLDRHTYGTDPSAARFSSVPSSR